MQRGGRGEWRQKETEADADTPAEIAKQIGDRGTEDQAGERNALL